MDEFKNATEDTPKKGRLAKTEETVTLSKEEFSALLQRVDLLEKKNAPAGPITLTRRVKDHTLDLREVYDDKGPKYVINLKKDNYGRVIFKEMRNDKGEPDMVVTAELLCSDGTHESQQMFYNLDLGNNTRRVTCPIIKTRKEEIITIHGTTNKTRVDGYRTIDTGVEVPLEVLTEKYWYTVKLPNDMEIEIEDTIINF